MAKHRVDPPLLKIGRFQDCPCCMSERMKCCLLADSKRDFPTTELAAVSKPSFPVRAGRPQVGPQIGQGAPALGEIEKPEFDEPRMYRHDPLTRFALRTPRLWIVMFLNPEAPDSRTRSEEHTSELQSLMRNSYAVFCLKKKT